ncbi:methyltransferase [Bradyrhizobium sp. CCBAU 11357]|uniref:methyltransferase n=1 Tax=Bradyrhizobium sp. CCBAU 11357 TaxID=1630808 RepID=UPI002301FECA|nr:methyltransferase [Bradyrhizobium sp. CCBAU 11357]
MAEAMRAAPIKRPARGNKRDITMAKLTKAEAKAHAEAVELLKKDVLTYDERVFVLDNWHEGASHINGSAGAFFTPCGLAGDFAIDAYGGRTVDLCAGIGALAFHVYWRAHHARGRDEPQKEIVCIERNPAYVDVGRKVLPEANWICADVFDLDLPSLGHFGCAIANPPFGATPRIGSGPRYTGRSFEFHVIDIASDIADYGAFIIPQASAPFQYSGVQCYRERKSADYLKFTEQTGIHLEAGCGVDCSYYRDGWKGIAPNVEIVCANFEEIPRNKARSSAEPEAELRALLGKNGVPVERQDAIIRDVEAKARGGIRFDERPLQADLFNDLGPYAPKR